MKIIWLVSMNRMLKKNFHFMKKTWKINIMMQFLSKGKDQLRSSYEKHIVHSDYSAELLEYLPVDGDDHR
jgi:hypothetical protein